MAQAQVVITAVDRTKSAISQAERGLKALEKTAKITGKAINLSFGLITGGLLVSAFGKIADAAKKTEEGQRAMAELSRTLKDPALVSAANSLTGTLINGFNTAIQFAAKSFKFVRAELIKLGAMNPNGTAQDVQSILEGQLRQTTRASTMLLPGEASGELSAVEMANAMAAREAAKARIPLLQKQLDLVRGLADAEIAANNARIDRELAEEAKSGKKKPSSKADGGKTFQQMVDEIRAKAFEYRRSLYEDMVKDLEKFSSKELQDFSINLDEIVLSSNVAEILKDRLGMMGDFVQSAAIQMRDAFADFLFNPFENGLRGMLVGFMNTIRRMLAELVAKQALLAFFGMFTGGTGVVSQIANAAIEAIGTRASGGPVSANTPYLVGERGPELFMPSSSGSIVPNHKMGGGVVISPVYNIDARGATADLQAALPSILKENNRRIFDELDRRYGIGR